MSDPNVIEFPKPKRRHQEMDSDERHAAAVFAAWRSLLRRIEKARRFGLMVSYDCETKPRITKNYGSKQERSP